MVARRAAAGTAAASCRRNAGAAARRSVRRSATRASRQGQRCVVVNHPRQRRREPSPSTGQLAPMNAPPLHLCSDSLMRFVAKDCPCGCGRELGPGSRRLARRALRIESLIPAVEELRDQLGHRSWAHAVEQGRMFSHTYLALAHGTSGRVADSLTTRRTRWKFHANARDWEKTTLRLGDVPRTQDAQQ